MVESESDLKCVRVLCSDKKYGVLIGCLHANALSVALRMCLILLFLVPFVHFLAYASPALLCAR